MRQQVTATVTLAEGFSLLRKEVSLLNVFQVLDGPGTYDFVVHATMLGLSQKARGEVTIEVMQEVDGLPTIATASAEATRGLVPGVGFVFVPMDDVVFPAAGRYNIMVKVDGEVASQHPLFVKARDA